MPSFILRNLDPEFWAKVQAKAAAEGVTVKALILRLLSQWLAVVILAVLTVGCSRRRTNRRACRRCPCAHTARRRASR